MTVGGSLSTEIPRFFRGRFFLCMWLRPARDETALPSLGNRPGLRLDRHRDLPFYGARWRLTLLTPVCLVSPMSCPAFVRVSPIWAASDPLGLREGAEWKVRHPRHPRPAPPSRTREHGERRALTVTVPPSSRECTRGNVCSRVLVAYNHGVS